MTKLICGLDEIATETQLSEGWCYFCIPESEYSKFEEEVRNLLSGTELTFFHGRDINADQSTEYEEFLRIIRRHAENSAPTILSCTLDSLNWKRQFNGFCERVTTNVLTQVGITNQELIDVCRQLIPGLFSFIRLISHFGNDYELSIEIDSDNVKEKYPNLKTIIRGHNINATFLMTRLYNSYRDFKFPTSPTVTKNGISVLKDQRSFAIQAADVIGSFSTSFVYYKLGNTSKKRVLRGQIFERVFGDKFGTEDFTRKGRLVEQNDLEILQEGAFTMEFSAYYER